MKRTLVCIALCLSVSALLVPAADEAPWVSLFDGKTLDGWTTADGKPVSAGWEAADGVLHRAAKGGDIYTAKEYGDFELEFEWKISPGGNSGVKYRVIKIGNGYLGPEYQVLDDEKHPDGKRGGGTHSTAALYDLIAAKADKPVKPVGEWNASKVVVKGTKIEHWLNGAKVVDVDMADETFKQALAKSKFAKAAGYALKPGRIQLQDHGNEVWFRALRIRPLQ